MNTLFGTPTTKAVGLNFATNSEPTALVVGVLIQNKLLFEKQWFCYTLNRGQGVKGGEVKAGV